MNFPTHISERIIDSGHTILSALQRMDSINKKLLLVFDRSVFVGVLSIGDIQKVLINNLPLDTIIKDVLRKNFVYATETDDKETVYSIMYKNRIECMPILDNSKQLLSVYLWEELVNDSSVNLSTKIGLPVVIMAGGLGSRLKPLTNILPKPLLPVGSKTITEKIMDKFVEVGCSEFYLSVNYKSDIIQYYFDNLNNVDYQIKYVIEKIPLGTGGSLSLLKDTITTTFFVTNCDILIEQDIVEILEYHRAYGNEITAVAAMKHVPIPYGLFDTGMGGKLTRLTEKPELIFKINTGFYIMEPHLLNEIPANINFNITVLFEKLINEKRNVGIFPISEGSWRDIGEWDEYLKTIRT